MSNTFKYEKGTTNPRGRPGTTSAVDVRAAILGVAEELFAERGYSATSIRTIADAAGFTPAMVHYYFGNKESLLQAVLEKALEPLARLIEEMKSADAVAPEEMVRSLMTIVAEHPTLPYLVIREVMLPGGVMQAHFASHLAPRLGGALPGLLEREQREGRIRDDLPPTTGALVVMALALFPFIVRPVAEQALKLRLSGKALLKFQDHVSAFVKRGFSA